MDKALMPVTYLDKLTSPLPFLPWLLFSLVAMVFLSWVLIKVVNKFMTPGYDIGPQLKKGNFAIAIFWGLIFSATILVFGGLLERSAFGTVLDRGNQYDGTFRRATVTYFGSTYAWQHFKAQGQAESRLRAKVCSPVGACGLMQIMPATARELRVDPLRPHQAIWAGIKYDRQMAKQWASPRPDWDRLAFALASYNAGLRNVLNFQVAAGGATLWREVVPFAWKEPRDYVARISRWCTRFGGWGCFPKEE